jgi:primosomal protein N' (replication factor Y)
VNKKYIIQVAPIIPLPILRTQVFSYWCDEDLPVGTLVTAPFYYREIRGIVLGSKKYIQKNSNLKLKDIRSIVEKKYLGENQIKLAEMISDYYFAPLGTILKIMVPSFAKARKTSKDKLHKPDKIKAIGKVAHDIFKSDKKEFLLISDAAQRDEINLDLVRLCLKKNKQCLILAPEIFSSHAMFEKLKSAFSEEIALIHSRITKGQYYDCWQKIREGKIKIVVATKMGIFLPFFDLGLVVVTDEQDSSYKQSKAMPRYHAVKSAQYLAQISRAKIIFESSLPTPEIFQEAKSDHIEVIKPDDDKQKSRTLEIATFERNKRDSDFPISRALQDNLAAVLKEKKQAVIFVNRRGFSTRSFCENCKAVLKCPKCDKALVYSEENGKYYCLHCSYKMDLLNACPKCGGFQFSHRGVGTQTVEKRLKSIFPSAIISRFDADKAVSPVKYKKILEEFSKGKIDILIGTQSVVKGIYSSNVGLAASISALDFSDNADFQSRETALSRVFNVANLVGSSGKIVVQDFFSGSLVFKIFQEKNIEIFLDQELALRKRFSYPPFSKFVRISFRDKSAAKTKSETKKAFDLLQRASNNKIEIISPYGSEIRQKNGLYQQNILLKIDPESDLRRMSARSILGGLRKGWTVDVDPISLF